MTTHEEDAVKLDADGIVDLFQIELRTGAILRLKANDTATWQGSEWEGIAIQLSGTHTTTDGEMSRPTLTLANPQGVLSSYVINGHLEKSVVKRFRMLRDNLDNDRNIFVQHSWFISRVATINKQTVSFELRNPIDGPNFLCPYRMFLPPEFPAVSLG